MEFVAIIFMVVVLSAAQLALFARNSFRHFEYTCFFTKDEVMEGDEVGLVEIVSNRKWLPLPWLKSELSTSRWLEYAGFPIGSGGGPPVRPQLFRTEKLPEGFPHLESQVPQAWRFRNPPGRSGRFRFAGFFQLFLFCQGSHPVNRSSPPVGKQ